jgi:hypothetical protein
MNIVAAYQIATHFDLSNRWTSARLPKDQAVKPDAGSRIQYARTLA